MTGCAGACWTGAGDSTGSARSQAIPWQHSHPMAGPPLARATLQGTAWGRRTHQQLQPGVSSLNNPDFKGTELISVQRAKLPQLLSTPLAATIPFGFPRLLRLPPALQKIWGNGRHTGTLKNPTARSSPENTTYSCLGARVVSPCPSSNPTGSGGASAPLGAEEGQGEPGLPAEPHGRTPTGFEHLQIKKLKS